MAKLLMMPGLGAVEGLAQGKKNALYNTLEEFHKYWERIDIVIPRVKDQSAQTLFGNVFIHSSPWPLLLHPFFFITKAASLHRRIKFDLVTVHEFPPFYNGVGAWLLWKIIRVPYVLEILHVPGYPRASSFRERIYLVAMRWFVAFDAAKAKAVRVMNKKEVPDFLIRAGVPKEKIKLIPAIYIDQTVFRPQGVEKKYDLIFVGRLEKNKGADMFVKSVAELGVKAIIVGTGPLEKNLKALAKKIGADIVFHGFAKDAHEVAHLISESRAFVMCSYNEGGPRVVAEAMACGVPVVATRVGIVPDIVPVEQQCDWDSTDIADKAKRLLSDSGAYKSARSIGLESVKQFEKVSAIKFYADQLKSIANQ